MSKKFVVTSSPHLRSGATTSNIMRDVLLALAPALAASIYYFGVRAAMMCVMCVTACMFFEFAYRKALKMPDTTGDFSAALTGLLLAFNLPSSLPFWMALIGCFVSIVIVKQMFGGLGKNFANPAIVGRVVLLLSFTAPMTTWPVPRGMVTAAIDAVTAPTPLASAIEVLPTYTQLFLGQIGGSLGETCKLALLAGGIYLVFRKVITITIPLAYLGSVAVFAMLLGQDSLYHLLAGGAILGAIFMATDYVTSPTTERGKLIFGIGCGFITMVIRVFGSMPEGASFAILLMNVLTPFIDRLTTNKAFGGEKKK